MTAHVEAKGQEILEKYGPEMGWDALMAVLKDKACVRYPCELRFDAGPLQPGEMAYPVPSGQRPEDGFVVCVHPYFATQRQRVPAIVLYQLVAVNYGDFASPDDAETFGAAALGRPKEEYYKELCAMADELG